MNANGTGISELNWNFQFCRKNNLQRILRVLVIHDIKVRKTLQLIHQVQIVTLPLHQISTSRIHTYVRYSYMCTLVNLNNVIENKLRNSGSG